MNKLKVSATYWVVLLLALLVIFVLAITTQHHLISDLVVNIKPFESEKPW